MQNILMPLLIFLSQIVILTVATIRIIFISKSNKIVSTILGFVEVTLWLLAIQQIMLNLDNFWYYFAYASGFAMGNYIGVFIEAKMAIGKEIVRIITRREAHDLIECLKEEGFNVTTIDAEGSIGPVNVIYTIAKRSDIRQLLAIINKYNPRAFYTIEDAKYVKQGEYPFRNTYRRSFFDHMKLKKFVK